MILTAAVLIIVVIVFVVFYTKRNKSSSEESESASKTKNLSQEQAGAKAVAMVRRFARSQGYKVVAPAHIAKEGRFADLDCVLVGYFGILGVKCIGLGGEVYGAANDAKWLQVSRGERIPFENPLNTASVDTRVIRDTLFTAKIKNVQVDTVCVFTNDAATLAIGRDTGHYTLKSFKALLRKGKYVVDKKVDVESCVTAIRAFCAE